MPIKGEVRKPQVKGAQNSYLDPRRLCLLLVFLEMSGLNDSVTEKVSFLSKGIVSRLVFSLSRSHLYILFGAMNNPVLGGRNLHLGTFSSLQMDLNFFSDD